jgi:heme-degrading monooxygenase HmoA
MPYVLIRHTVADYATWKPVYDEHANTRKASGSKGARLFRNANNPQEMLILLEWDDLEKARQFTQSAELRQAMQRAGVTDQPDIYFLEEVQWTPA